MIEWWLSLPTHQWAAAVFILSMSFGIACSVFFEWAITKLVAFCREWEDNREVDRRWKKAVQSGHIRMKDFE